MILGLLFCCRGVLFASEADELRERAKAMRKEAEQKSAKLREAADRLESKARERSEDGNRPSIDKEVQRRKERLRNLLVDERKLKEGNAPEHELAWMRGQIAGTEREIHMLQERHGEQAEPRPEFHVQVEMLETASRKIHHLRVAAENLKMAGADDIAHKLMEQADSMERDVQEGKKRLAAQMQKAHGGEQGPDVVQELRAEIERLRAEVKELRQKVENR
jgi:hypothetical protein